MSPAPIDARTRAVVRAVEGLTTQLKRVADTLATPVVENVRAVDDDATTPATTCSARYTGVLPVGDCIRAAGHAPAIDHTDESGRHFGDNSAEYPVHDGPELLGMRVGIDPGAEPGPAMVIGHWLPMSEQQRQEQRELAGMVGEFIDAQVQQARAADEDACLAHIKGACDGTTRDCVRAESEDSLRFLRRESLLVLLTRLQRGRTLTEAEADTLRQHVETEIREANAERAEADALDVELTRIRRALDPNDERYIQETVDDFLNLNAKLDEATDTLRRVRAVTQAWEPRLLPRSEAHRLFVQVRDALAGPRPDRDEQPTT